MIRFPCHCSYRFELPDDMAGGLMQCPKCGRLNDVPTLSDLPHIADDGTFEISQPPSSDAEQRLPELKRIYSSDKIDEQTGEEKDLRPTEADYARIGQDDAASAGSPVPGPAPSPIRPKYDPETGERVREIQVQQAEEDRPDIPMARPAPLGYATALQRHHVPIRRVFFELFTPINLAVMFFVFMAHMSFMILIIIAFCLWATLGLHGSIINIFLTVLLLAHYGNTIIETGPDGRDELPRPLRDLNFSEDIWHPFTRMFLALLICFGPALLIIRWMPAPASLIPAMMAAAMGMLLFPAVTLTSLAGGTYLNFRPDRLVEIMRITGGRYVAAVALWAPAILLNAWVLFGYDTIGATLAMNYPWTGWINEWSVLFPMLSLAVFFAHWAAWHTGLLYRQEHERFGWVMQRYVRRPLRPRIVPPPVRPGP